MVPDAPRFAHARGSENDRAGNRIEPDRFGNLVDIVDGGIVENIFAAGIFKLRDIFFEDTLVARLASGEST